MRDPNISSPDSKPGDVSYNVMPDISNTGAQDNSEPSMFPGEIREPDGSIFQNKWFYIALAAVILIGAAGYLYFSGAFQGSKEEPVSETKLPKTWLLQYFNTETCQDLAVCGDDADPDGDGLSNLDEFKEGTNPIKVDTDGDGLADADEKFVFKTDPTLKYTDRRSIAAQNDYNDGVGFQNDYDPNIPGTKLSATRKEQLRADIDVHPLHDLTKTTLSKTDNYIATIMKQDSEAPIGNNFTVFIEQSQFIPVTVFIQANDKVTWQNKDLNAHVIVFDATSAESSEITKSNAYTQNFPQAGTYSYHLKSNPDISGEVIVK